MSYLVEVLVWIVAVFGTTTIVVNSTIMEPVRNLITKLVPLLGKLVNCFLCTSFWIGVFWATLHWDPFHQHGANAFLSALFAGCIGSGASWIMYLKIFPLMQNK
tara:strand:+ start:252 stop:563 length:312 start_codon:yes stop_codon:yes gene_type:complete